MPRIPGLELLSEIGRDGATRRYRLASTHEFLVLFEDPDVAARVEEAARTFGAVPVPALARVTRLLRHEGRIGVVVEGDPGQDAWRHPVLGEAAALPVLHQVAAVIAAVHARGLAHGHLKPHAIGIEEDGSVLVLPPLLVPGWLTEPARREGRGLLSPVAQDLADLGDLACHLVGGLAPHRSSGVGAVPGPLKAVASPRTAQAVGILLETAAADPDPADSLEVLNRLGWARAEEVPEPGARGGGGHPRVVLRRAPAAPAEATQRSEATAAGVPAAAVGEAAEDAAPAAVRRPVPVPARERTPRSAGGRPLAGLVLATALLVLGGLALVVTQSDGAGDDGALARLPSVADPLARPTPGELEDAAAASALPHADGTAPAATPEATALADAILEELRRKQEERTRLRPAGTPRGYDRSLIEEGDRLKSQGLEILGDIRDGKVAREQQNAQRDAAIQFLEQAREKYEGFAEQYPDRERLVEGILEDVNATLFHAYRQRTRSD